MHLRVHTSNDLHHLLAAVAARFTADPLPPHLRETILVQSQGMARWMTLELARRTGIAASLVARFPATFLRDLAERLAGSKAPDPDPFDLEHLPFHLFHLLHSHRNDARAGALAHYLGDDTDGRMRWQLAARTARCFLQYALFRPHMLAAWKQGDNPNEHRHAPWQALLWQSLCAAFPATPSPADLVLDLHRRLAIKVDADHLPPRLTVFGVSHLPRPYVELLSALGRHIPVDLYLIRSTPHMVDDQHPLEELWGYQGRTFLDTLLEVEQNALACEPEAYSTPTGDQPTVLGALQTDLLHTDREHTAVTSALAAGPDRSLTCHQCPSTLREMQVLRDQLYRAFEDLDDLCADQVLVLLPDVPAYAPFVHAVFGNAPRGLPPLRYRVADRTLGQASPLFGAFLRLLAVARGRNDAPSVLELLDVEAIARAFAIPKGEREALRGLVERAGIRWGMDGAHRWEVFAVPPSEDHTWRRGLDRLLLGQCTGPVETLVAGLLPEGQDTAGRLELLGSFCRFTDSLFALGRNLHRQRSLAAWAELLDGAIDRFLTPEGDGEERGLTLLHTAVDRLRTSNDAEPVAAAVVLEALEQASSQMGSGEAFLGGGITFCALVPMRSVPFRVIAVCGLDAVAFPRRPEPAPFDLVAQDPTKDDRTALHDDRQLFLEILLSARDRLTLSWVAPPTRGADPRPPSSCVGDLLDLLDGCRQGTAKALVTKHPLHAHSPALFAADDPQSYDPLACAGARAAVGPRRKVLPLVEQPLPAAAGVQAQALEDLCRFWQGPAAAFCRAVGLELRDREEPPDEEPLEVRGLDRWKLDDAVLATRRGVERDDEREMMAARGLLPHGPVGTATHHQRRLAMTPLVARERELEFVDPVEVRIAGDGWVVTGVLDRLTVADQRFVTPSKVKDNGKHWLAPWIRHLCLCAMAAGNQALPRETRVFGLDAEIEFGFVEDAVEVLEELALGMVAGKREPLPFFPRTSLAYASKLPEVTGRDADVEGKRLLLRAEFTNWESWLAAPPEGRAQEVRLAFRDRHPLDDEGFDTWARRVCVPMLRAAGRVQGDA